MRTLRALSRSWVWTFRQKSISIVVHDEFEESFEPSAGNSVICSVESEQGEQGLEYSYKTRKGRTRIYGGKVTENICQGIARCIIGGQMLQIAKKYRVVLTVHDSIVTCVRDEEVAEAQAYVEECMRWTPDWAEGLPVNCESGVGKSYGEC